jgi:hypothetical protein
MNEELDAMGTIRSYDEFEPVLDVFLGEMKAAIRYEEADLADWATESHEYMLACAESALIRLRAAAKLGDEELVRDNAIDLGLAALKIAAVQGGI